MTGAPARGQGVGIVGVALRVFNAKVVEINGLIGLDAAERHHYIHKEPNAALMTCNHQGCNIQGSPSPAFIAIAGSKCWNRKSRIRVNDSWRGPRLANHRTSLFDSLFRRKYFNCLVTSERV